MWLLPCLSQGLFSSARGAEPVFRIFRYQASPWRYGAGFKFDISLRARCPLFFSREKRPGGALRGGVRGGVQLGDVAASSMFAWGYCGTLRFSLPHKTQASRFPLPRSRRSGSTKPLPHPEQGAAGPPPNFLKISENFWRPRRRSHARGPRWPSSPGTRGCQSSSRPRE